MILSFEVPDITGLPIGTCCPLIGDVIFILCVIGGDGDKPSNLEVLIATTIMRTYKNVDLMIQ